MNKAIYLLVLCPFFVGCGSDEQKKPVELPPLSDTVRASRRMWKFDMEGPIVGDYVLDSLSVGTPVEQRVVLQFMPEDILIVSTSLSGIPDTILYNRVQVVPEFKVLVTGSTSDLQIIQVEDSLMWVKFLPPDSSQFAMNYFVQFANNKNPKFLPFRKI